MLFRPEGLIPSRRVALELHEGVHDEPLYDVAACEGEERERRTTRSSMRQDVRKVFGGLVAVNNVYFTVPRGKVVSLIGPNGAGKTTFFNMLTGVYKPTGGTIIFLGEDVTGKPPHAITARGIGRTFQNIRLFQNMTALENVLVGMHSRLKANLFNSILRTPGVRKRGARLTRARDGAARVHGLRRKSERAAHATCPTATSAGSRSPARSRPSRSCCCSTSRRQA